MGVGFVGVDVGDFGRVEFVEGVACVEAELEHFVAVAIAGEEEDATDFLVADEGEDFVTFFRVALPRIFASFVGVLGPEGAGAEDFELGAGFAEGFFEPVFLEVAEEGFSFAMTVVAAIGHDEVDVSDDEVEEGAGLFFATSVGWVVPVLGVDLEVLELPVGLEGFGAAFVVVGGEVVVIPDGVDGGGGGEVAIGGVELAAVVVDALLLLVLGEVDVEVVAEGEVGEGLLGGEDVPDAFELGDVTGAGSEGDGEFPVMSSFWCGAEG